MSHPGVWIAGALGVSLTLACGNDAPDLAEAGYVGRETCATCHADVSARWAGSHHDLAMQEATDQSVLGDFDDATFTHRGVTSAFYRRDGGFFVRTEGPTGEPREYPVAYTFGVTPLQQYLVPFPGGRYQALSIAWDSREAAVGGQRWFHLYPDQDIDLESPFHWTQPGQSWNTTCAECHSTNLEKGFDVQSSSFRTTWSEIDVSCEACHGPGSRHVALAGRGPNVRRDGGLAVALGRVDRTWTLESGVSTATLGSPGPTGPTEIDTCAACHSRRVRISDQGSPGGAFLDSYRPSLLRDGLYHADGQVDDEVYVYGSFLQSKMYAAGVTCSDCHDPHSLDTRAPGNALCTRCHEAGRFDTRAHHFHDLGSQGASCVECHMPSTTYMVVDPRRDHGIRVPRPDLTRDIGTPNACNGCHQDRPVQWALDAMVQWYGPTEPLPHYGTAIAGGRARDPAAFPSLVEVATDTTQPAMVRASAFSLLGAYPRNRVVAALRTGLADPRPLVRVGALEGVEGLPPDATLGLAYPLLSDSMRAVRIAAARVLAMAPGGRLTSEQARAIAVGLGEYEHAQMVNADHSGSWVELGDLRAIRGNRADAERSFLTAIALDSTDLAAHLNLADLHRARGRDDLGERALQRALALDPEAPELLHAMGLLRVRQGNAEEALRWLGGAVDRRPDDPRFAYVYGVALASADEMDLGIATLERALVRHPFDRDLLSALATYSRDLGRVEAALGYAERLARVVPEDAGVQELLAQLRSARR